MQIIEDKLDLDLKVYPYSELGNLDELLFLDIETTGFMAKSSTLYMIGCAYYQDDNFNTIQWFAESNDEEELLLYHFTNFVLGSHRGCIPYTRLIHYNGNQFDIPYLEAKCEAYSIDFDFNNYIGIDIYKRIQPYKNFLKLSSLKQKAIEEFLNIPRNDDYDGGQLIEVYNNYLKNPDISYIALLMAHNYADIKGLIQIVPILAYTDIFNEPIKVIKAGRNPYTDVNGNLMNEIIMEFKLPAPIPKPISYGFSDCYFTAEDSTGKIRVALYDGTLKFFYPNYKDYYYIPDEDMAIHKSVASFVDPSRRQQAKASNCYGKLESMFLPQWKPLFLPYFKEEYGNKTMYFELSPEFKKDSAKFSEYANHIMSTLLSLS